MRVTLTETDRLSNIEDTKGSEKAGAQLSRAISRSTSFKPSANRLVITLSAGCSTFEQHSSGALNAGSTRDTALPGSLCLGNTTTSDTTYQLHAIKLYNCREKRTSAEATRPQDANSRLEQTVAINQEDIARFLQNIQVTNTESELLRSGLSFQSRAIWCTRLPAEGSSRRLNKQGKIAWTSSKLCAMALRTMLFAIGED